MKAYMLGIRDDPDQGSQVVFADNATDAKRQLSDDFIYDRWIDIECHRYKSMDGKEKLDRAHLMLELWRDHCWRWWDINYPDPDTATDEEFLWWYHVTFDRKKS